MIKLTILIYSILNKMPRDRFTWTVKYQKSLSNAWLGLKLNNNLNRIISYTLIQKTNRILKNKMTCINMECLKITITKGKITWILYYKKNFRIFQAYSPEIEALLSINLIRIKKFRLIFRIFTPKKVILSQNI